MLGRAPDPDGLSYYLSRLRAGVPKVQILMQMHFSSEGENRLINLPGFNKTFRRFKNTQIPLIGLCFKVFYSEFGNDPFFAKLRSIENQLLTLDIEI